VHYPLSDGWVLTAQKQCCLYDEVDRWFEQPCTFSGFVPPLPFTDESAGLSNSFCGTPSGNYPVFVHYAYAPEDALSAKGPIDDYSTQPYDYQTAAPPDPGVATVTDRIRSELESDNYPTLNQKYEYELGTPNACDPVEPFVCNPPERTSVEDQRKCELGDRGTHQDPDPTRTIEKNDPALYERHQTFAAKGIDGGEWFPDLYKGWTDEHAGADGWGGWGWRHIDAKHGWRQADIDATAQALQSTPIRQDNGALRYVGAQYEQNGALCERWVIVWDTRRDDDEPQPPGIVTSFGRFVAPLP
jgi:hypothetical protein